MRGSSPRMTRIEFGTTPALQRTASCALRSVRGTDWGCRCTGNFVCWRPLNPEQIQGEPMVPAKHAYRKDMLLAGLMVVTGLAMSGISAAELLTARHHQMA